MGEPTFGVAYRFFTSLDSRSGPGFKTDPAIAAGDFQVATGDGGFADLARLPVVETPGGDIVRVDLSAAEMSADRIMVLAVDSAGDEWEDTLMFIDTHDTEASEVYDSRANDSTTVTQSDRSRILTIFKTDGTTVKARVQISEDGATRTEIPLG